MIKYSDGSEVDLVFDEKVHKYRIGEDIVPSVTKIIDGIIPIYLTDWAAKAGADWWMSNYHRCIENEPDMVGEYNTYIYDGIRNAHKNVSQTALDIGKDVHKYIESVIQWSMESYSEGYAGEMPEMPENEAAVNSIKAFGEWVKENDVEWISTEERIYSKKYNYAGTVDAVAKIDNKLSVIDFKTSKKIYKNYKLQIYAYKQAIEEIYGEKVESCWILRFDKETGKFQALRARDDYLPAFLKGLDFLNEYKRRR